MMVSYSLQFLSRPWVANIFTFECSFYVLDLTSGCFSVLEFQKFSYLASLNPLFSLSLKLRNNAGVREEIL